MKINVFADTICGWCFIGHANLNNALKKFPNVKFNIHHVPFQLNPDMPAKGISREKYLEIKFGGKDSATPMYENMKLKAKESGMNFNLDKIKKTPNTVLSHLLINLSEQFNIQNEIIDKIYQSYFIDGFDIGDINILINISYLGFHHLIYLCHRYIMESDYHSLCICTYVLKRKRLIYDY